MQPLPFQTAALPPVGGKQGPEPEHFIVDEVPLYSPVGQGEHWYVRLRKRRRTTPELVRAVAQVAGVKERDIGYAGLKDKHAVTSQWLSLPRTAQAPEAWRLAPDFEVLEVSKHANKLRTGHLSANRFQITLVGVPASAPQNAAAIAAELGSGLLNYFGVQRFGFGGRNVEAAQSFVQQSSQGRGRRSRFDAKFLPSVLQSAIFNAYLSLRREAGLNHVLRGEVLRLNGSKVVFRAEDPNTETPRLQAGDVHLTGPMVGPRTLAASDQALELEQVALAAFGLGAPELDALARFAPGARRDLLAPLEGLAVNADTAGQLRLTFTLPPGSYATQVVREFTRSDGPAGDREAPAEPDAEPLESGENP